MFDGAAGGKKGTDAARARRGNGESPSKYREIKKIGTDAVNQKRRPPERVDPPVVSRITDSLDGSTREREREREEKNSVTDSVNVARTDRRRGATPLEWRSFGDKEKKKYSTDESNKKNYAFPLISQREEREKRTKKKKMVLNKGDNGEPLWAPLRVDWTHRNVH